MSEQKATAAAPMLDKANSDLYMLNVATNRYVLKNGITGKRLKREMSRREIADHIRHQSVDAALANRNLMASNLSDTELLTILRKIIDIRIDKDIKLTDAMPARNISQSPPSSPPKLVRQVGIEKLQPPPPAPRKKSRRKQKKPKKPKKSKQTSRRRYVVRAPPPEETTDFETTAYEQTDAFSDSGSDSSDISD